MSESQVVISGTPAQDRVLWVEDDDKLQEILSDSLRADDFSLCWVKTGREALEAVAGERFSLVLLDLGLPEKDGFEVLQELKSNPATDSIPVIVVTAWNRMPDKLRGFELGAVDYITKPFELVELRARIRSVLRSRRLQDGLRQVNRELDAARQAAEQVARGKAEFLANMSHEIRTPMNGVIAMTSLLLQTELSPEQRDFVETIRSSGESLLSIINDILNFSKIESGKIELEHRPLDLRACVEAALDVVAAKAAEKGLDLGYQLEGPTPTQIVGDVTRLRQILVNLIGNAIKFTQSGEVFVHVVAQPSPVAPPTGLPGEGSASGGDSPVAAWDFHFSVRDTGIGIPEDRIGRLFKSFSQADGSIARQFGGTGLGLAISKGLAELMGGRIWVESQFGQGSVFHVKLPLRAMPGSSQSTAFRPRVAGKRVLIVDDNPTHRRILTDLAHRWAMVPCAVEGAIQALDQVRGGDCFDFAIIDAQLPGMNGGQVADELRRFPHAQSLPVLLMTPIGARTDLPPSARSAFTAVLTKPLKPAQLQAALLQLVSGAKPDAGIPGPVPTRGPLLASRCPLRVLVADDNVINQKVASRMLQQMGYKADVASNGLDVIQALERAPYDMILMDVQMPELDGLEATRRIRQRQQEPAPHPHFQRSLAIIAMTANAMHGDREKCLAAGMDEYLPKPIRLEALRSLIERFGGGLGKSAGPPSGPEAISAVQPPPTGRSPGPPLTSDAGPAPVDLDRLTEFAGGNPDAFRELVDIFVQQTTEQIGLMEVALQTGAADRLARVAHSCAGASSTAGMLAVVPALRRLEALGQVGDLAAAPPQLTAVRQEFDRIKRFLEKQPNPTPQSSPD